MKIFDINNCSDFLERINERATIGVAEAEEKVKIIINDVRENGDEAVKKYTKKFDCENAVYYAVPDELLDKAFSEADKDLILSLKKCKSNIEAYHEKQKQNGFNIAKENGILMGQRTRGLDKAGIYVPGGSAAYPSSVLMCAVPAKIAGVGEIIMVTPPQKDGMPNMDILAAAKLCGVDKVFLCGGAQAVAALAFGTDEIPKVSKIVGPGNVYVTAAKKLLYGTVDIDMTAGPSEILILADESANPAYIAADLMSQAEHDRLASSVLITTSREVANETVKEINKQVELMRRKDIILESLHNYGAVIIADNKKQAVELANKLAPEHLEVLFENPLEYIGKIDNAASVFLGQYSPEPLGDYYAGPNHVLPTNGSARFFSPLSVETFTKKSSWLYYTKDALKEAAEDIMLVARREGLTAHENSIKVRCEK